MVFTNNHVRCAVCKYVRPDKKASSRKWTALECGNSKSEYYGCLLNIRPDGEKLPWISWTGCEYGSEKRDVI